MDDPHDFQFRCFRLMDHACGVTVLSDADLRDHINFVIQHALAHHGENLRMRDALADIAAGCGMLSQPAALNGPEEAWLRKRIRRYETVARCVLDGEAE